MQDLSPEIQYSFSRSSGPGGQNVNKVNTRVELRFHVNNSLLLNSNQKVKISTKLDNRINNEGEIVLTSDETRSQSKNKEIVTQKFYDLLEKALKKEKPRIATRPSRQSKEKRLKEKKLKAEKKESRKKPDSDK
jgi:ribosome-associated protein